MADLIANKPVNINSRSPPAAIPVGLDILRQAAYCAGRRRSVSPMSAVNITPENREDQMRKVQEEGIELFKKKNADYGDAFATYGPIGVLVRMGDKIQRLQSITRSGIVLNDEEKIRDTLIDLHNYAAMAIMLMDDKEIQT